jgi:phosphoribosylamine--glycine ligase
LNFGCSLTLAGYGYPFTRCAARIAAGSGRQIRLRRVVERSRARRGRQIGRATGHRIADVIALAPKLDAAIAKAYANIRKIRVVGSYFRTDIGQSLWPPGMPIPRRTTANPVSQTHKHSPTTKMPAAWSSSRSAA